MKKVLTVLLALILVFSLASCDALSSFSKDSKSSKRHSRSKDDDDDDEEEDDDDDDDDDEPVETTTEETTAETTAEPSVTDEPEPTRPASSNGYISCYVDKYSDFDYGMIDDHYYTSSVFVNSLYIDDDNYQALQEQMDKDNEDRLDAYLTDYADYTEAAKTDAENGSEYANYYTSSKVRLHRADSKAFSYNYISSSYMGGAHGYTGYSGIVRDPATGKQLALSDVCVDTEALYSILYEYLDDIYDEVGLFDDYEDTIEQYISGEYIWNFYITRNGLVLQFNQYELASYASGPIFVSISYEGNESILDSYYWTDLPSDYVQEFNHEYTEYGDFYNIYYDYDNDGTDELIELHPTGGDYYYENLSIALDERGFDFEFYGYTLEPMLVVNDGKTYIYAGSTSDNDYIMIDVYEITADGEVKYVNYINGEPTVFVNPDDFQLDVRKDTLGTQNATGYYKMDTNGMPKLTEEYFYYYWRDYHLTQDINATDFYSGKAVTIPSGTTLYLVGSDDKTFVDMIDDDGNFYTIDYEVVDWQQKIDGKNVEDCFEEGDVQFAA